MAAAELNLPSVVISGGPMMAGQNKGKVLDLNSVFEGVGMRSAGKIDDAALQEIEDNACPGCGSCSGMFTANTMNCMMEVLGLALPGKRHRTRGTRGTHPPRERRGTRPSWTW